MSPQEFEDSFKIIDKRWPGKYSPEVVKEIFRSVRGFSQDEFEQVATKLCASSHRAPLVPDFMKAFGEIGARAKSVTTQEVRGKSVDLTTYWIRDDIWFNDQNVIIRRDPPGFINRADNPSHPLVLEANSAPKLHQSAPKTQAPEGFKTILSIVESV